MEIAILIFFIAIFGGVLFLLALIWFVFRRIRNSRSANRNFSGSSNYGSGYVPTHCNSRDSDDDSGAIYADNSTVENQNSEEAVVTETAHDSPHQSDNTSSSHESRYASSAPAETNYTENSYSSYDSGSSSYDSSSSSSDSGSSSSSSD